MNRWVFAIFFALVLLGAVYAASAEPAATDSGTVGLSEIRLRSRQFIPQPKAGLDTASFVRTENGNSHVLLQLDHIPSELEKQQLAVHGITLLNYIPVNTWLTSVSSEGVQHAMSLPSVTAMANLQPADKINPALASGSVYEPWVVNGRLILMVQFFGDVSPEEAESVLARHDGGVAAHVKELDIFVANLPVGNYESLASEDTVMWMEQELPMEALNDIARVDVNADQANVAPYSLNGSGVNVMVYDSDLAYNHTDFTGRFAWGEAGPIGDHATHVMGSVGGDGTRSAAEGGGALQWRGMAPSVNFTSYETDGGCVETPLCLYNSTANIADLVADVADGITNHDIHQFTASVGAQPAQWGVSCTLEGDYSLYAVATDFVVYNNSLPMTWAAANERGWVACGLYYDTMSPTATGKNVMTIGAINSDTDTMTSFSSWGPADDGRVKPDISAPGCRVGGTGGIKSANADNEYEVMCGTSMATPVTAGVVALTIQAFRQNNSGADPWPSTIKALLIHTSKDLNNTGPDYTTGHGRINVTKVVDVIRAENSTNEQIIESNVSDGANREYFITVPGGQSSLMLTLVWTDYPGTALAATALVNDLDLVVLAPNGTQYYPWMLNGSNPSALATRDTKNNIDNVEMVNVTPLPGSGIWTIRVNGTSVPNGPQNFSLVSNLDLDSTACVPPSGNWNISSGTSCASENITVGGNLTIGPGGNLTLDDTTLVMNSSFGIVVASGGLLVVRNSTLVANDINSSGNVLIDPSTVWLNGNWTIGAGQTNITDNSIIRVNLTTNGTLGIHAESGSTMFILNGSNITNGETAQTRYFFIVDSGASLVINDSYMSRCGYEGASSHRGPYISATNVVISNSTFTSNYNGIYFASVTGGVIIDSTVNNNDRYGIFVSSGSGNYVIHNTVNNNGQEGIIIYISSGNNIINNTASGDLSGIRVDTNANANLIYNNTVTGNSNGFYINSVEDNRFINNTANSNTIGFRLLSSTNNSFTVNTVTGNTAHGFYLSTASDNNTLARNTLINNDRGFYLSASSGNVLSENNASISGTWAFYSKSSSARNMVVNLSVDNSLLSFESLDVALNTTGTPPADPGGYVNLSTYINVSNISTDSWIYLNVSYSSAAISGLNESNLRMWKNNGSWSEVPGINGVDTTANFVYANISSFSIFAPLVFNDSTPPSITVNSPTSTYNTTVNQTWAYVNATVNDTGSNISSCLLEWNVSANITMTMLGTGKNVVCYYNKTNIAPNGDYTYKIFVNDSASPSNAANTTAWANINYSGINLAPVGFTISLNANNNSINLEWNASPGAALYDVYYSTNASRIVDSSLLGPPDMVTSLAGNGNTAWNHTNSSKNTTLYYRVASSAGVQAFTSNSVGKHTVNITPSNVSGSKMNLISLPLPVSNYSLSSLVRMSVQNLTTISYYNVSTSPPAYQTALYKDGQWQGDFTELWAGASFVVTNTEAFNFTVVGDISNSTQNVTINVTNSTVGELEVNSFGWASPTVRDFDLALPDVPNGTVIVYYNATTGVYNSSAKIGGAFFGGFSRFEPGKGYFITANESFTGSYSTT